MRIVIITILVLISSSLVFAVDTDLGKVNLTKNQIQHIREVGGIKGLSYWEDGTVITVSDKELTDDEKTQILSQLKNLPDIEISAPKTLEERVSDLEEKVK